jgi:hypothetical protein
MADSIVTSEVITAARNMGTYLQAEGISVAKAITLPIMTIQMTFLGFAVMFRANIVEKLTEFTIKCVILYFLVYAAALPIQTMITKSMDSLKDAGVIVAQNIISKGGAQGSSGEPTEYWKNWIGDGTNKKFSYRYIKDHIWPQARDLEVSNSTTDDGSSGWTGLKNLVGNGLAEAVLKIASFLKPLMAMPIVFSAAFAQYAGMLAPMFVDVGIVGGAYLSFYFVLGVGMAVLPLLFFGSMKDIFVHYLTVLIALALVPFFYYVLMAIGFVFSTTVFHAMFENGSSIAVVLSDTFESALKAAIEALKEQDRQGSFVGSTLLEIINYFKNVSYLSGGSIIITGFISAGCLFGTIAIPVAFSWNKAFATEMMIQIVGNAFNQIQGALGSGVSQIYGQGLQYAQMALGAGSSFGGALFGGLRGLKR